MHRRESSLEASCKRVAEEAGFELLKLWPISRGLPDRMLLATRGRVMFIEFKQPGRRPTPMQLWWRDKLQALGFSWEVVDNAERFRAIIRMYQT